MLRGKNILLGICGGIAAYKSADIVSRLKKLGANVDVVMTKAATEFITPLTLQSLSQNFVNVDMFGEPKKWDIEHIALAKKADVYLVISATANVLGKVANGIADDMLTTTVMATKAPVLFAPAMNTNMYENPIVQDNIRKLKSYGYHFIDPASGRLACGDVGKGKLATPDDIIEHLEYILCNKRLCGKKAVVTAGPTREKIDPVRFISNFSSGKMGYELARSLAHEGAEVTLISGPSTVLPSAFVETIYVESADDMHGEVMKRLDSSNIVVLSAAVADYKSKNYENSKIKKQQGAKDISLELTENVDIAAEIAKVKKDQYVIGFAAETDNLVLNAQKKLEKKGFDMIVANDITKEGAGFNIDTNIVNLIKKDGSIQELPLMTKRELAARIADEIIWIVQSKN